MRLQLLGLLLGWLSFVSALSAAGSKLLVVLEEESEKSKYSQFIEDLQDRGFQITFRSPKDTSLSLFQHGVPAYSHLLLLPAKSKGLGPALTPNLLVDFVNQGSNVLVALSSEQAIPSAVSSLLLELDISLPADRNSIVVDHFNYDTKSASEKHELLLLQSPEFSKKETKNFFSVGNVLAFPHAVGQVLGSASPLLQSVLKAPKTAYIYNHKEADSEALEDVFATGDQISLVTAFQARNSARVTVLGSVEALEDKYFAATVQLPGSGQKSTKTGNRDFARQVSAWTFMELGVLKVNSIEHHLNEAAQSSSKDVATVESNPSIYRIKNNVAYSISISEWETDNWRPFAPPTGDDLQLEFSMLSPFHRLNLAATSKTDNATTFTTEFKLPDQHGIFNFYTEYRRPFYTTVEEKRTVTVRHFAHDGWPRSYVISGAWPWISGIWVTVLGWLGFVALWLYSKPAQPRSDMRAGKR